MNNNNDLMAYAMPMPRQEPSKKETIWPEGFTVLPTYTTPEEVAQFTVHDVQADDGNLELCPEEGADEAAVLVPPQELFDLVEKQEMTLSVIARGLVGVQVVAGRFGNTWRLIGLLKRKEED